MKTKIEKDFYRQFGYWSRFPFLKDTLVQVFDLSIILGNLNNFQ